MSYMTMGTNTLNALDTFDQTFSSAVTGSFEFELNVKGRVDRQSDVGRFIADENYVPGIFDQIDKRVAEFIANASVSDDLDFVKERSMLDFTVYSGRGDQVEIPVSLYVHRNSKNDRNPCFYGYLLGSRTTRFQLKDGRWLVKTKANLFVVDLATTNGVTGRVVTYRRQFQPLMIPAINSPSCDLIPDHGILLREMISALIRDEPFLHSSSMDVKRRFWNLTGLTTQVTLTDAQKAEFVRLRKEIKKIRVHCPQLDDVTVSKYYPPLLEEIVDLLEKTSCAF